MFCFCLLTLLSITIIHFFVTQLVIECVFRCLETDLETNVRVTFLVIGLSGRAGWKFAEMEVNNLAKRSEEKQLIVSNCQRSQISDCRFITDMIQNGASISQVIDLLVREEFVLMNRTDGFFFEVQVTQSQRVCGERSVRVNILDKEEGIEKTKFFEENPPVILDVPRSVLEDCSLVVAN